MGRLIFNKRIIKLIKFYNILLLFVYYFCLYTTFVCILLLFVYYFCLSTSISSIKVLISL